MGWSSHETFGYIVMSSIVLSIFLLSIGASFIQRTTGFGFGIFIMTMLPFLMPTYGEATTLSGLLAITTSAAIVWRLRNYVTWQRLWPILLTFIIVSTIAIFALTRIEDHILRRILGVALILISIYFMLFSTRIKLPTTKKVQVGAGALSGLMGGFFTTFLMKQSLGRFGFGKTSLGFGLFIINIFSLLFLPGNRNAHLQQPPLRHSRSSLLSLSECLRQYKASRKVRQWCPCIASGNYALHNNPFR